MKAKIIAAVITSVIAAQSHAQAPTSVFVSTRILQGNGCNSNGSIASINETFVNGLVREALIRKGYTIAKSKDDATDGLRAQYDVTLCGTSYGSVVQYTASVGMYAISKGSSKAVPTMTEVPFNYSNAFAFASGDPTKNQAARLMEYLKPQILDHIKTAF